jgi:hypothetical protein
MSGFVLVDHLRAREQESFHLRRLAGDMDALVQIERQGHALLRQWTSPKPDPRVIYHHIQLWNELRDATTPELSADTARPDEVWQALVRLTEVKSQTSDELLAVAARLRDQRSRLLMAGAVPVALLLLATLALAVWIRRQIGKARRRVQQRALEIAIALRELRSAADGPPFQNADFWLQVALLAIDKGGDLVDHPIAQFLSETSVLIRQELKKTGSRPDARKD